MSEKKPIRRVYDKKHRVSETIGALRHFNFDQDKAAESLGITVAGLRSRYNRDIEIRNFIDSGEVPKWMSTNGQPPPQIEAAQLQLIQLPKSKKAEAIQIANNVISDLKKLIDLID